MVACPNSAPDSLTPSHARPVPAGAALVVVVRMEVAVVLIVVAAEVVTAVVDLVALVANVAVSKSHLEVRFAY